MCLPFPSLSMLGVKPRDLYMQLYVYSNVVLLLSFLCFTVFQQLIMKKPIFTSGDHAYIMNFNGLLHLVAPAELGLQLQSRRSVNELIKSFLSDLSCQELFQKEQFILWSQSHLVVSKGGRGCKSWASMGVRDLTDRTVL